MRKLRHYGAAESDRVPEAHSGGTGGVPGGLQLSLIHLFELLNLRARVETQADGAIRNRGSGKGLP
jgi:hypothetical protein